MKLSRLLLALVFGCIGVQPLTASAEERDEVLPVKPDARQIIRLLTPDPPEPAPPHIPYPEAMAEHCAEGSVVVEFTVTRGGRTSDIFVLERTAPLFGAHAVQVVERQRYQPVPKPVTGLRITLDYRIEVDTAGPSCEDSIEERHRDFDGVKPDPIHVTSPKYPFIYSEEPITADIKLGFAISDKGTVTDPLILASATWNGEVRSHRWNDVFERSSLDALSRWRFPPPTINRRPTQQRAVQVTFRYRFRDNSARVPTFEWSYD